MTRRDELTIRADLAAALAAGAGVDRSSRIWARFESEAISMLADHTHAPPADANGPVNVLLAEHFALAEAKREERRKRTVAHDAHWREFHGKREAAVAPPTGYKFLDVKGIDGKSYRLTLPIEQVRCLSSGGE